MPQLDWIAPEEIEETLQRFPSRHQLNNVAWDGSEPRIGSWHMQRSFRVRTAADVISDRHSEQAAKEHAQVAAQIEDSKYMLGLEANWDDDGATAISKQVWQLACQFARNISLWGNKYRHFSLGELSVSPLSSGGIDLFWENSFGDLLISVPPQGKLGSFYGRNQSGEIFSGSVDLEDECPEWVIDWLKKRGKKY